MSYNGIEEAISQLYEIIQDARSVPLSSDKCMVERDQISDLLDEISNELPNELKAGQDDRRFPQRGHHQRQARRRGHP